MDRLSAFPEKDQLLRELETTKDNLNTLLKQHEELEVKSKSDIKVLVKEVKSLRRSQIELKQKLNDKKTEVEVGYGFCSLRKCYFFLWFLIFSFSELFLTSHVFCYR